MRLIYDGVKGVNKNKCIECKELLESPIWWGPGFSRGWPTCVQGRAEGSGAVWVLWGWAEGLEGELRGPGLSWGTQGWVGSPGSRLSSLGLSWGTQGWAGASGSGPPGLGLSWRTRGRAGGSRAGLRGPGPLTGENILWSPGCSLVHIQLCFYFPLRTRNLASAVMTSPDVHLPPPPLSPSLFFLLLYSIVNFLNTTININKSCPDASCSFTGEYGGTAQ